MSEHPPFSPIAYATPVTGRPGILTAVGVISIVVGSLSALASLFGIASGFMYIAMSRMTFPTATMTPTTTVWPTTAPTTVPGTAGASTSMPVGSYSASSRVVITNVGTSTTSWSSASSTPGTTTFTTSTTAPAAPAAFAMQVDLGASVLTIVEGVLSLAAAVLLIVAGSFLLRDSSSSRRLHRLYLILKFPLIAVAATANWWLTSSMMTGMAAMMPPGSPSVAGIGNFMALFQAGLHAVISLIYPIALLIVLSTKTAKTYFNQIATTPQS